MATSWRGFRLWKDTEDDADSDAARQQEAKDADLPPLTVQVSFQSDVGLDPAEHGSQSKGQTGPHSVSHLLRSKLEPKQIKVCPAH